MDEIAQTRDYCICLMDRLEDRAVSERLIEEVGSYKLPKKAKGLQSDMTYANSSLLVIKPGEALNAEQQAILSASRWLMVICTPLAREDEGIRGVIRCFMRQKGRDPILPILLEGEPQSAFPPEFFKERVTQMTFANGQTQTFNEVIEPLAIDLRSSDLKGSLSLIRHAKIKVVAALIGVSYDTLEQRHDKRMRRRLRILASVILSVPIIL
ncbi:MAG: hypothetical protein N2376_00085, partial [Clostridia bacterium]|nr:hypothetical protein [Clostridia bacterium]